MSYCIRPAREEGLIYLPAIEYSAATPCRADSTLVVLAGEEPTSVRKHEAKIAECRAMGARRECLY